MRALVILGLLLLVGVESRVVSGTLPDQGDEQLEQQNVLNYFVEEKDRLMGELERLQLMVRTWDEELRSETANSSVKTEKVASQPFQKLFESFLKVQQLEKLLNETRIEGRQLRARAEQCEAKVADMNGKVENRTKEMQQQANNIKQKLVTTFNRHRVWRALRTGLEAVLDPDSPEYVQLQRLGYDEVNPLKKASGETGYEKLLDMLLHAGLDVDMVVGPNDWTMLHYSTYSDQLPVAELLLRHGAHPEMMNDERKTPLVLMATHNKLASLKMLVERGAYVNSVDKRGYSSLHYSAANDQLAAAKFLVDHGALTALKNKDGRTARSLAGSNSVAKYLAAFEG